jgi:hypothetical protein
MIFALVRAGWRTRTIFSAHLNTARSTGGSYCTGTSIGESPQDRGDSDVGWRADQDLRIGASGLYDQLLEPVY